MVTHAVPSRSTAAAAVDQTSKGSDSDADPEELGDDEEYEEIEVEEEVEVEEEASEEEEEEEVVEEEEEEEEQDEEQQQRAEGEDDDDSDFGEDLSPIGEDQDKDDSHVMESLIHEEHLKVCSSVQRESVAILQPSMHADESSGGNPDISGTRETVQCKELHFNGKEAQKIGGDMSHNSKTPPCENGIMISETSNPSSVSVREVTTAVPVIDGSHGGAKGIHYSEEKIQETKQMDMQTGVGTKQLDCRSNVPLMRSRSLTPDAHIKEGNKRQAVTCDFFARGWCIKGNSCRFLHIKDDRDSPCHQEENSVGVNTQESGLYINLGLRVGKRGSNGLPEASNSPVNTSAPSERIPPWEHIERPRWKQESEELQLHKDNPKGISTVKGVGSESLRQNWYLDKSSSPINADRPFRNVFTHSLDSSSSSPQLISGISPSRHTSAWPTSSSFFGSYTDSFGTHKDLDGDMHASSSRSASLQRSVSPFPGSEPEHPTRFNSSGDSQSAAGSRIKFSYDWEPSVPFRSSFLMSQKLTSPGSQYDPIRDSIEQPNLRNGLSRFPSSGQGTSISSMNFPKKASPALTSIFGPDYSSDKHSLGTHQDSRSDTMSKSNYDCDYFRAKADCVEISVGDQENKHLSAKENKITSLVHAKDVTQASEEHVDSDLMFQKDAPRHKERKGHGPSQNAEVDFNTKIDGDMHKESKALKHFRASLIEFVKELVKPTWREGHLSKDAHKLIVKKAVEKVLCTLPSQQIPHTAESVDMYLSLSQPKIAKLVEGYVEKYGKL